MKRLRHEKGVRVKLHSADSTVRAHRGDAWAGRFKPRVPIQEPTGRFALTSSPVKPQHRRTAKPSRVRKAALWLWRNAESLCWAAVLTTLSLSLWFSPRTQLTRLRVLGVPAEAHAAVEQAIRNQLRTPIALSEAPRQLERTLQQVDWIQHAQWRATGVQQAHLQITPRIPDVLIETADGSQIFADPAGFLFVPPNRTLKPLSGRIRLGQGYPRPQRGDILNGEMRRAFTILQQLHTRSDLHHLRVWLSQTRGIRLWCEFQRDLAPRFPLQVRFGDARDLPVQLERLRRILLMPLEQLSNSDYIDISTPGAEVIKPRSTTVGG
ncbi:MAG: hypothetical protein KatS3mg019_0226 [Fimbriimonadales bacterium]|nr:MAG: hypothetical protein KatS3mg019_0226 [Fimbriimonadales bacterium]